MSVPESVALEAIAPGMEFGDTVFGPLQRADIVRYAGASGDFNPIHIDDDYARASGSPEVFAMGMLPAGYLAHALCDWMGGPHGLRRYKVRFVTRVWVGDEIVCRSRVEEIDGDLVTMRLEASRRGAGPAGLELPGEEVALLGSAQVQVGG
jgi:acyl dehydratase